MKYFAQINFVIEADSCESAEVYKDYIRALVSNIKQVVEATADEPVEADDFGHAG